MTTEDLDLDGPEADDQGTNGSHPDFSVAVVPDALDTHTSVESFRSLIAGVAQGRWKSKVAAVRKAYETGGKEAAAAPKKRLPAVLWSGTFSQRNNDSLLSHSGLICVDLDNLGDALPGIREQVESDPHTLAAFVSPTGAGLKVIFRCDPSKPHIESFRAAEAFVMERFGLEVDRACKDVSRMCFVSHDPEAFAAHDAIPLEYPAHAAAGRTEFKAPTERLPASHLLQGLQPWDDYDQRGDLSALLMSRGWTKVGAHGWRRPDKSDGISATFGKVPGRFYVFTSSTEFEPLHTYRPWHVYAILKHGGDWSAAVRGLRADGFGVKDESWKAKRAGENGTAPPTPSADLVGRPITDFSYPTGDDPNVLLGSDDYLGRGGGLLFVSYAGAGKSSWALDACMSWGLGRPWMGIRCAKPLKTLVVQAEDSDRYLGKIRSSFSHVHQLSPEQESQMGANVIVVRLKGVRGALFLAELLRLTEHYKPDLVVINPIYIYADGDISKSECAAEFLSGLDAVNKDEKFAYILIHHTGKPAAKGKDGSRAAVADWESIYMGMGSSFFANWPRCSILLEPVPDKQGQFVLRLGKGGLNAGVTQEVDGRPEPTTKIAIQHSSAKMLVAGVERPVYYWEASTGVPESDTPAKKMGRAPKYTFDLLRHIFPAPTEAPKRMKELHRAAMQNAPIGNEGNFFKLLQRFIDEGHVESVLIDPGTRGYRTRNQVAAGAQYRGD